jgi:hypothetical protein
VLREQKKQSRRSGSDPALAGEKPDVKPALVMPDSISVSWPNRSGIHIDRIYGFLLVGSLQVDRLSQE